MKQDAHNLHRDGWLVYRWMRAVRKKLGFFFFCDDLQLLADKKTKQNSICQIRQGSTWITRSVASAVTGSPNPWLISLALWKILSHRVRWKLTGQTKHSVVDWMKDNARLFFIWVTTDMLVIVQKAHGHWTRSIYFTNIDYTNYTLLIMQ